MTDEELSVAVARGVFGAEERVRDVWTGRVLSGKARPCFIREGRHVFIMESGREGRRQISPSNPVAVYYVCEHMRERWMETAEGRRGEPKCWRLESFHDGWRATVVWQHHDGDIEMHSAAAPSLGRALFECALLMAAQEAV
jgi:hypothetical protein